MATIHPVSIDMRMPDDFVEAVSASVFSVACVLAVSAPARARCIDLLPGLALVASRRGIADLLLDGGRLFGVDLVRKAADGALECTFAPSEWYIELVAAIAECEGVGAPCAALDWPILSGGGGAPWAGGGAA